VAAAVNENADPPLTHVCSTDLLEARLLGVCGIKGKAEVQGGCSQPIQVHVKVPTLTVIQP
jgi:hypothetical protein